MQSRKPYVFMMLPILLMAACQSSGQTADQQQSPGEWITLFDGESLDQWRGYNRDDVPDAWSIEGDELVFTPGTGDGGDLITREIFGDFEFTLEYNISEGGNSGLFHHVLEQDQAIYWSGPEFQIIDDEAMSGSDIKNLSAALYDLIGPDPQNAKPAGEWNTVRIVSQGPRVEYWQNGELVVEFERWTAEWYDRVRDSKFAPHPSFGNIPEGHLGLQDHGDPVRFRNVQVRRL